MMVDALIQFVAAFFRHHCFFCDLFCSPGALSGLWNDRGDWAGFFTGALRLIWGCPIWAELFSQRFLWCCSPEYAAWRLSAQPRCFCLPVSSPFGSRGRNLLDRLLHDLSERWSKAPLMDGRPSELPSPSCLRLYLCFEIPQPWIGAIGRKVAVKERKRKEKRTSRMKRNDILHPDFFSINNFELTIKNFLLVIIDFSYQFRRKKMYNGGCQNK